MPPSPDGNAARSTSIARLTVAGLRWPLVSSPQRRSEAAPTPATTAPGPKAAASRRSVSRSWVGKCCDHGKEVLRSRRGAHLSHESLEHRVCGTPAERID